MKTVTRTYEVYNYSELSEEAKAVVREWYLDNIHTAQDFTEMQTEDLKYLFPNSKLKLQYSLAYCQGDGLNIYGKVNVMDLFNIIRDRQSYGKTFKNFGDVMTEQQQKAIEAYAGVCGWSVEIPRNNGHYEYCIADKTEFAEDWIYELKDAGYKNINTDVIFKFEEIVRDIFEELSAQYEKCGYGYFYEVDDEEIEDGCEANGWTFFEDGSYCAA